MTPAKLVTPMLYFGASSNVASDVGYVVLIPLGAMVAWHAAAIRSPESRAAAFAGVSGGFLRQFADRNAGSHAGRYQLRGGAVGLPGYVVEPSANWYFGDRVHLFDRGAGSWVTDRIVEPSGWRRKTDLREGSVKAARPMDCPASRPIPPPSDRSAVSTGREKGHLTRQYKLSLCWLWRSPCWHGRRILFQEPETKSLISSPFMTGLIKGSPRCLVPPWFTAAVFPAHTKAR